MSRAENMRAKSKAETARTLSEVDYLLGVIDKNPHSYLEIAYAIIQSGTSPNSDLEEMWRRIIFTDFKHRRSFKKPWFFIWTS